MVKYMKCLPEVISKRLYTLKLIKCSYHTIKYKYRYIYLHIFTHDIRWHHTASRYIVKCVTRVGEVVKLEIGLGIGRFLFEFQTLFIYNFESISYQFPEPTMHTLTLSVAIGHDLITRNEQQSYTIKTNLRFFCKLYNLIFNLYIDSRHDHD